MSANCECCERVISNNDYPYCSECQHDDSVKLRGLYKTLGSWSKAEAKLEKLKEIRTE